MQHSCSHSNAICNHSCKKRIELRTQEQPLVAKHIEGTTTTAAATAAAPAAHTRYLSSPAAATLRGKTQGFVPRLPPRATFMQPLQCVSQHHVADPLCTWQHQMTAIMQPVQCDPQPEIQETHRTTHTGTTTPCRTQRRNQFAHETTPAATAAHTRYLSSSATATLHRKTTGFVLRLPAQHKPHATFMQPLLCILQHSLHHHFP